MTHERSHLLRTLSESGKPLESPAADGRPQGEAKGRTPVEALQLVKTVESSRRERLPVGRQFRYGLAYSFVEFHTGKVNNYFRIRTPVTYPYTTVNTKCQIINNLHFWHTFCILIWHEQKHIYANQKFQPIWTVRYQQI